MHILFVCTGNTCRSPMAAFFARAEIHARNLPWTVESAGLYAAPGLPMSPAAADVLTHRRIPLQSHRSQPITPALVDKSDIILTMTHSHAVELRARYPHAADKIVEFGRYVHPELNAEEVQYDIVDPFGGSDEHYEACAVELEKGVRYLLDHMEKGEAE